MGSSISLYILYPGNVQYNYSIKLDKHGVLASFKEKKNNVLRMLAESFFLARAMLWPTLINIELFVTTGDRRPLGMVMG
jgi:hypothetical protein